MPEADGPGDVKPFAVGATMAQDVAHSLLIGLSRPFVKAHAESST
jgi:hypothetical protein